MEPSNQSNAAGEYLRFRAGEHELGLPLSVLQEIVEYPTVTVVPNTPEWIRGVFNLRGQVLPLIDLGMHFGLEPLPVSDKTRVLISNVDLGVIVVPMGIVADYVQSVLHVNAEDLVPPPAFGTKIFVDFLAGMVRNVEPMLMLVDVVKAFSQEKLLQAAMNDARVRQKVEAARQTTSEPHRLEATSDQAPAAPISELDEDDELVGFNTFSSLPPEPPEATLVKGPQIRITESPERESDAVNPTRAE